MIVNDNRILHSPQPSQNSMRKTGVTMKRIIATAFVAFMFFDSVVEAPAATLIDTVQGDTFCAQVCGYLVSHNANADEGEVIALPFTSGAVTITGIQANIGMAGGVDLGIMADVSGAPSGTFIAGAHAVVSLGNTPINLVSLNWSLGAGSYWLVAMATAGTTAAWQINANLTGTFGSMSLAAPNEWTVWSGRPVPEAIITTADISETPLPAALPLFATGAGAIGLLGWRKRRKNAWQRPD